MEKLLPCPFCGGAAEMDNSDHCAYEWAKCTECGAEGPQRNYNSERGSALAAWNRRALPAPESGCEAAVKAERERCAGIADYGAQRAYRDFVDEKADGARDMAEEIAAAIRADRSEK